MFYISIDTKPINRWHIFKSYGFLRLKAYLVGNEFVSKLLFSFSSETTFQSGERLEVEIRGCSIWAVEVRCFCPHIVCKNLLVALYFRDRSVLLPLQ